MSDLLQQASDDQLALILCFAAMLTCGLIMHFSHYVGRLAGRGQTPQVPRHEPALRGIRSLPAAFSESPTAREKAA